MPPIIARRLATLLKMLTLIVIASCESPDRRLAEYAQTATQQQSRQNERLAQQSEAVVKQSQEVAAAAHSLVEQDAAARRDLIQAQDQLQQQIQSQQTRLDLQRQKLDAERKSAAQAIVRDPVIAQAILSAGLFLAALLPLIVTAYTLRRLPNQNRVDELLADALLNGLDVNPSSDLSPSSPRPLPDPAAPRLGGPDEATPPSGENLGH